MTSLNKTSIHLFIYKIWSKRFGLLAAPLIMHWLIRLLFSIKKLEHGSSMRSELFNWNFSSSCQKWILVTRQLYQKARRRFHESSSSTAARTGLRGRVNRVRWRERGKRLRRMIIQPHPSENCGMRLAVPKDTLTIGTLKRTVGVSLSIFFIFLHVCLLDIFFRQTVTIIC